MNNPWFGVRNRKLVWLASWTLALTALGLVFFVGMMLHPVIALFVAAFLAQLAYKTACAIALRRVMRERDS